MHHIIGLCLESVGSECQPKKTWFERHSLTIYINSTAYCTTIELEHHRGPCRCQCQLNNSSCHARQQFLPSSCSCQCLPSLADDKSECTARGNKWDPDSCRCQCSKVCAKETFLDKDTCKCKKVSPPCYSDTTVYLVNITVLFLVIVMVTISTLYWISRVRRRAVQFKSRQLDPSLEEQSCTFSVERDLSDTMKSYRAY